jgi:hypothetical protein
MTLVLHEYCIYLMIVYLEIEVKCKDCRFSGNLMYSSDMCLGKQTPEMGRGSPGGYMTMV